LFTALLLSGCQTYQGQTTRTRQTEDRLIEQENQRRMAGRLETLEMEIGRISRELDTLSRSVENRCAAIERKSEKDKRELIARLTAQLEKLLMQTSVPAAAPAASGGTAYGYEHVVRQGETLSTIAKAYNVTAKAIIEANRIKDANRLSIGQKLFIPE
ncbi:MAG: LysM peptidoglycan-binding domain-containing protein, partial [bacterium]|nr:LysM peptidoglycan-binding domain-containing protein [bacterium]